MTAYYNECDPYAAEWLRNLIKAGLIADGHVDERSIEDVKPTDLVGYTQHHFFAGIGGWSLALRLAGWPDERPVYTGSCPCQPFSAAGKGAGFSDERHLWPAFFHLSTNGIGQGVPVFGEQVASSDGLAWLNLVQADCEGAGYTFRAEDRCGASIGAPHIRQRLYWMAYLRGAGLSERECDGQIQRETMDASQGQAIVSGGNSERLGNSPSSGSLSGAHPGIHSSKESAGSRNGEPERSGTDVRPSATNGFWRDADWLRCTDDKWRPVESFFQSLANGLSCGMGSVRPEIIKEVEKEIDASSIQATKQDLRNLWERLPSTENAQQLLGGSYGISKAEILFAFLCQLSAQGWYFAELIPCSGQETSWKELRELWNTAKASGSSRRYGLDKQQAGEHSDVMRFLSSLLARYAHQAWDDALYKNAELRSPLALGVPGRVGRLRAYGNAIIPQVAAEFVRSYLCI